MKAAATAAGFALLLAACAQLSSAAPYSLVRAATPLSGSSPFNRCPRGRTIAGAEEEPYLAVDPSDSRHLVAVWQQDRNPPGAALGIAAAVSFDGGARWRRSVLTGLTRCAGGSDDLASDAWVSIGAGHAVFALSLALGPRNRYQVLSSTSPDGGVSWRSPAALTTTSEPPLQLDKPSLLADAGTAGRAYAVWIGYDTTAPDGSGDRVYFSRTTDGGQTWSAPAVIHQGSEAQFNQLLQLNGRVLLDLFVVGAPLQAAAGARGPPAGSPPVRIEALRSDDLGRTWTGPYVAAALTEAGVSDPGSKRRVRAAAAGFSAAGGINGPVYVAWFQRRQDHTQVLLSESADGVTWSAPRVVESESSQAFLPTVAVAGDGTPAVLWYDFRRYRTGSPQLSTDVWLALSPKPGRSWITRHVAGSFDLLTAPDSNGLFVGDYQGLIGLPHGFVAAFVQSRPAARKGPTDIFFWSLGS